MAASYASEIFVHFGEIPIHECFAFEFSLIEPQLFTYFFFSDVCFRFIWLLGFT